MTPRRTVPPARRSSGTRHHVHRRRLALALTIALVTLGVALRIAYVNVPVYTPDEDAYANFYASNLLFHGFSSWPEIVREYQRRPEMLQFPSPTRVGHLAAIVGWMQIRGSTSIRAAAEVSVIASCLGLVLVGAIAWEFIAPWAAPLAVGFAAVAPLDRALSRRVWGDSLVALLVLAMLYAFARHLRQPERRRWNLAVFALGAATVLVKESGLFFLALGTLGMVIFRPGRGVARAGLGFNLAAAALALAVAVATLALASGGLAPLRATFARAAVAASSNAYMQEFQRGGPGYYVTGFARTQPVSMLLGFAAAVAALAAPGWRRRLATPWARSTVVTFAVLVLAYAALAFVYPQKNLRFLSPLFAPLDLLAAWLVWTVLDSLRTRLPRRAFVTALVSTIILLAASAIFEQQRFVHYFIDHGVPDLATPWFTRADR
jgi:hypothetical protein